jgi:hypothetical protein
VLDIDGDKQLNQDDPDDDADGFADADEAHVGTSAQEQCGTAGFPADTSAAGVSANRVDLLDVTSFLAPVRRIGANVADAPGNARFDLKPGRGMFSTDINLHDLTTVITAKHPLLPGRAFGGGACVPAP